MTESNLDSNLFVGMVTSTDAITYTTQIQTFGGHLKSPMQGIPLAGVFATTLGFKESAQYSVGQLVLCYGFSYTHCYILGAIPDNDMANLQYPIRANLAGPDGNADAQNLLGYNQSSKMATFNQQRPTDLVEGEYALSNEYGVLLGLFQGLAQLKGSELAQIQCFLLDDLVRIISHNYEHLHALGEFKIFHDGKALMAEFGATHLPQEAMGIPQVEKAKDDKPFSEGKTSASGPGRGKAIERVKIFLGRVGDMVHMFLTRPDPDAVRSLTGQLNGKFDTGMADMHVGLDGRISVRTATAMNLEKTNWIRVPQRVKTAEDPTGDHAVEIGFSEKDPFKFDNTRLYRENPSLYFLQMRDCNTYIQDFYNFKNFATYKKDFKVSAGPTSEETNLKDIKQVDPHTPVNFADYKLRRSGVYLMDNGGVMIKDAWGSAIVMEGGDIYIQAAKDEIHQPLRNYIAKAGQFVSIAAKKDVDISSTEEGFRLKTQKVQHFYSHEEGIVLQSESENPTPPFPPTDEAYSKFGGILLKTKQSVYTYGKNIFDRADEKALYKADELLLESIDKKIGLKTKNEIEVTAKKDIRIIAQDQITMLAKTGNLTAIAGGSGMFAGAQTLLGNVGSNISMVPAPGSMFPCQYEGVLPVPKLTASIGDTYLKRADKEVYQQYFAPFHEDKVFKEIKFHFLKSDKYRLKPLQDHIPMTISQQEDKTFEFLNLETWTEKEINKTLPFPGKDKFSQYYITSELKNLQKLEDDVYSKDSEGLQKEAKLVTSSLQNYKVARY